MRRSLFLLCAICGSLIGTHVYAQPPGAGRGSDSGGTFPGQPSRPPRAAVPKDEDLRQIQLEVAILDVPAAEVASGPLTDAEQLARLGRLETEGKLAGVQRMKTTLVANQVATFQMGETVQVVTGRNRSPNVDPAGRGGFPGGFNEIRSAQQVGTMVSVTARPIAGGAVADIRLERSGIVPAKQPDAADGAPNDYPKSRTMTISTTVLFTDGETKIIGSNQQAKADGKEETWVLAKVTVGASVKPVAANSTINIFQLKNVRAKDAAAMIDAIFIGKNIRVVADARTNTALVVSAPEEEMKQIEAILMKLDEGVAAPADQPTPRTSEAPLFNPNSLRKLPTVRDPLDKLDPVSR